MALTYRTKQKHNTIAFTLITVFVICAVFAGLIATFRFEAEKEAYESLHIQTREIKDDLTLQIKSDNENLITMANFAAKLHMRGEDYSLMFDSFKPIGLFSRIGILTPDGIFTTKDESVDLKEKLPFEEAVLMGKHITGRTYSYSEPDEEVVRSAVPIEVNGETVAIIYGIIKIETINKKYEEMVKNLNAQLFVYDKETGKFIVNTVEETPGELSQLKNRKYNKRYSYEQLVTKDKGFSSFKSIYTGEDVYVYYSTIEDLNWGLILVRYETQVFARTRKITNNLFITFSCMLLVVSVYLYIIIKNEKKRTKIATESANIRKLLLSVNKKHQNIEEALNKVKAFSGSRNAFFIDTDGEDYKDNLDEENSHSLVGDDRKYVIAELFKYSAKIRNSSNTTISHMSVVLNGHLEKTNKELYDFLTECKINEISFAIISEENNHTSLLGVVNPRKKSLVKALLEDIAVCFSIAVYNNKNLNKTEFIATTDSLTGALNRVAYKNDILRLNEEKPKDFSCIYIDVNELNLINNKYGHSAGDEMLIYISNSLKEVFFGHFVYRMGGDEFLVFAEEIAQSDIKEKTAMFFEQLKLKGYTAAIGLSYRSQCFNCEEMVREAEIRMYEAKAQYYQNKEDHDHLQIKEESFQQLNTGIKEIDTIIGVLKEHYYGIFKVSLEADSVHRVLTPTYLGYKKKEKQFSKLLLNYIDDTVHPDYRRVVMSFLNYDAIKRHLLDGKIPTATFKKLSGEKVKLSVYNVSEGENIINETLWVFAKD